MASLSNIRHMSSTTTVEKSDLFKVEVPIKKLVYIVLDVSGSMAGSRLTKALEGIKFIFDECCGNSDHFALVAFNGSVHTVTPRRPKYAVKWATVAAETHKLCGGTTRLWDAVATAMDDIKGMPRAKDVHVDLVVLTDGEDNASPVGSVARLEANMGKPGIANFHAIFLACCGAEVNDMRRIKQGKKHVLIFEEASSDPESIARAFGRARTVLLERRTQHTVVASGGGAPMIQSKQTLTVKGSKGLGKEVLAAAAAECKAAPLQLAFSGVGVGGHSVPKQLAAAASQSPPLKLNFGSGGGGTVTKGLASGPIHPKSVLARNVVVLLAEAPGRCLPGSQFRQAYLARYGVELDYQGGQLKDLLERLEAGGSCLVERRSMPKGPALLYVHAALRRAPSC